MKELIEKIIYNDLILAIIIRSDHCKNGIEFFTPRDFSQQLAYMNRPAGYGITPHTHHKVQREIFQTQEVLFIKKGKVKVDLYDNNNSLVDTKILEAGDTILLAAGGHGFEMLEQSEIIEVKQGPYTGEHDKTRFET